MVKRAQIDNALDAYQTGLQTLLLLQTTFLFLWAFSSIVEGMGDVIQVAGFNAISHLGFWLSIEILTAGIGYTCLITNVKSERKERSVLKLYYFALIMAIVANVIHIIASIFELTECTSLLCVKNNGFLIAITVLFGILISIECLAMYFVYKYRRINKLK